MVEPPLASISGGVPAQSSILPSAKVPPPGVNSQRGFSPSIELSPPSELMATSSACAMAAPIAPMAAPTKPRLETSIFMIALSLLARRPFRQASKGRALQETRRLMTGCRHNRNGGFDCPPADDGTTKTNY